MDDTTAGASELYRPPKTAPTDDTTSLWRFLVRVLAVGSLLIVLDSFWIIAAENRVVWELTDFSFFPTVLFTLFALALLNLGLARISPRTAFTPAEMAAIYVMVSVATALSGHDIVRQLVPTIGNAFWYATPENEWAGLFHAHLPEWLTVRDRDVLRGYYEGGATFWRPAILRAWAKPFAAWTFFVVVLLLVMLCINVILRKQWAEHERLNYPITHLPVEMIGNPAAFFTSPLMWTGFGVAFGSEILAGLNYLYPVIPALRLKYEVGRYIIEKPWNAIGWTPIYVYPFAIGLGYVMPLDLSFSLWFFYVFWKGQFVLFRALGLPSGDAYQGEQRAGAWLAIGLIALWTSRHHIRRVVGGALRPGRAGAERDPVYRVALLGLVAGGIVLLVFWRMAGLAYWAAVLFFLVYLVLCIAMTRMRAELGPPTHELHGMWPQRLMVVFAGARPIGARNLSVMSLMAWMAYGYRSHPMPHQLEGFKIASTLRVRDRRLLVSLVVASVVGALCAIGFHIVLYYQYRFVIWGREYFTALQEWLAVPPGPNALHARSVLFGFAFTVALAALKRRFIWWPLYPVGYAVGYGWAISWMWFSIFLGWLSKRALLSGGGIGVYRRAMPLFLGFILGQFLAGSLWSLIGVLTVRNMYTLFP
jgi:hypothetical protein